MNRVAYADVLRGVAQLCGFAGNASENALALDEARRMRDCLSRRLEMGWEGDFWPELMLVEERRWTPNVWASGTSYALGTFVWYPVTEKYYQAVVSGGFSGQAPATLVAGEYETNIAYWIEAQFTTPDAEVWLATDAFVQGDLAISPVNGLVYVCHSATSSGVEPSVTAGQWGLVSVLERTVAYEQTGKTAIGAVEGVWDVDPRKYGTAEPLEFVMGADGVTVLLTKGEDYASVWVKFRKRCPLLFGEVFSATAVYASGDQVFFGSDTAGAGSFRGDFFDCIAVIPTTAGESPSSAAAKWSRVEIPRFLRRYLERGGASEYMRGEGDGPVLEGEAMAELERQRMLFRGEQGQGRGITVGTR